MQNEKTSFSLDSIKFIFRHPWLIIFPVFIISSMAFTYIFSSSLLYKSSAVISFESSGGANSIGLGKGQLIELRDDLLSKILLGEKLQNIITAVWPDLNQENNPVLYGNLKRQLEKNLNFISDRRNPLILSISFSDQNPSICYKIVKATVDSIIKENKAATSVKSESNLSFLKKQLDYYKERLNEINTEQAKIKSKFLKIYPQLNSTDRSLIREKLGMMNFEDIVDQNTKKFIKYEILLDQLNLELLELHAKKESVQKRLNTPMSKPDLLASKKFESDVLIKMYSKTIQDKELAIANLLSQDYAPEHPLVVKLFNEIENFKALREKRMEDLIGVRTDSSETAQTISTPELRDIEFQIEDIESKIKSTEEFLETFKVSQPAIDIESLQNELTRLRDLKNEGEITSISLKSFRKQLEEAELKNRAEIEKFGVNIKIVEEPVVPMQPIPLQRVTKLFMGFLLAIGIGVGLAYLIDSLNNPLSSSEELKDLLKIPLLGSVERIATGEEMNLLRRKRKLLTLALVGASIASCVLTRFFLLIKR